jgi:hypothetical protein
MGIQWATTSPSVLSMGPGHLDLYVAGTDSAMWHMGLEVGTWWGWGSIDNTIAWGTSPSVVTRGVGNVEVFFQGTDGSVYQSTYNEGYGWTTRWSSWFGNNVSAASWIPYSGLP